MLPELASTPEFFYDPPTFSAADEHFPQRDSAFQRPVCPGVLRMNLVRNNIVIACCCALMATASGCVRPWSTPFAKQGITKPPASNGIAPGAGSPISPLSSNDPAATDIAGVMDKLAQVREMDPAAEQKLLDELRRTPPSSWSLVAEQFRATLAMHQQLAAKPPKTEQPRDPMAEFRRTPPTEVPSDHATAVADASRPSGAIGALVDPRSAGPNSDAILAQSAPYSMPSLKGDPLTASPLDASPPGEFIASGPVNPIDGGRTGATQVAAFETAPGDPLHAAAQAIARAPDSASTPKPLESPGSTSNESWQILVTRAADDLSRRVTPSPTTTAEIHQHVSLRVLRLLAGDTERALEPIPHIPPAEQDYWSRQIFALATYLDHHSQPDDKRRAAAAVTHLDEAVSHLRELGALSLRNLSFCKNVYGYGAFEPYEADIFSPGQQVSLYVEVENYHSTSTEKGYSTLLGATYELLDDKGKRVSGGDFPDVDDSCRSRRRDFHIQFGLNLPQNLTPGRYRAEVVVKDRQSDKLGHASVPFEIKSGSKTTR